MLSLVIMLLLTTFTLSQVTLFNDDIAEAVFHRLEPYLIYTFIKDSPTVRATFTNVCQTGSTIKCAILDESADNFDKFRIFVGGQDLSEYIFILDVERRLKYLLDVGDEQITAFILNNFVQGFISGSLQPYRVSEKIPKKNYERCLKVVGKTVDMFMSVQAPIKVLYLTVKEHCESCGEALRSFTDVADKLYHPEVAVFGYYDLFMNDHPTITQVEVPAVLLFQGSTKRVIHGAQIDSLHITIAQAINQVLDQTTFERIYGSKPQSFDSSLFPNPKDLAAHEEQFNADVINKYDQMEL